MSIIGNRIRETRKNKGATQEDLAKAANTTKQTIYKYETGAITNIPSDKIESIAAFLGVSESYLMGWEPEMNFSIRVGDERELIEIYRSLSPQKMDHLLRYARLIKEEMNSIIASTIAKIRAINQEIKEKKEMEEQREQKKYEESAISDSLKIINAEIDRIEQVIKA